MREVNSREVEVYLVRSVGETRPRHDEEMSRREALRGGQLLVYVQLAGRVSSMRLPCRSVRIARWIGHYSVSLLDAEAVAYDDLKKDLGDGEAH